MKKIMVTFLMLLFPLVVTAGPESPLPLSTEDKLELHSVLYSTVESLKDLSERGYAPAQELLGLLTHDPNEIKNFLGKYDERTLVPHLPPSGHSRTFWQRFRDVQKEDISHVAKEADTYIYGGVFLLPAMSQLRLFFSKLERIDSKYDWSEFTKDFMSKILEKKSVYREYYLSSGVSVRCEKTFKTYFR